MVRSTVDTVVVWPDCRCMTARITTHDGQNADRSQNAQGLDQSPSLWFAAYRRGCGRSHG